ncbi:MAG: hypothetical protein Q7R96_05005, partial [Nanoarchaeota archaeon]|nr:hypothetical protein [Nanoarchaeota archaeon]
GAIMFYLIGEQHHRCEKSYAAMTRLELGQHMTEYQKDPSSRICIGSPAEKEQQMSELDTITYDLSRYMPHTVHQRAQDRFDLNLQGLEATCDEALRIASRKTP